MAPDPATPPRIDVIHPLSANSKLPDFQVNDMVYVEHDAHLDEVALRSYIAGACTFRIVYHAGRKDTPFCEISNEEEVRKYPPDAQAAIDTVRKIYGMGLNVHEIAIPMDSLSGHILLLKAFVDARAAYEGMVETFRTRARMLTVTGRCGVYEAIAHGYENAADSLNMEVSKFDLQIAEIFKIHSELMQMGESLHCPMKEWERILAEIVDPRRFASEHTIAACIDPHRTHHNRALQAAVRTWCKALRCDEETEWPAWVERQTAFQLYQMLTGREKDARTKGVTVRLIPAPFLERTIIDVKMIRDTDLESLKQYLAFLKENHPDAWALVSDALEAARKLAMKRMQKRAIRKLYRTWSTLVRT